MMSQTTNLLLATIAASCMLCLAQVRDPCRPTDDRYEAILKVEESALIGDVVYTVKFDGSDTEITLTASNNEYFAFDPVSRNMSVNGTIDADNNIGTQSVTVTCREKTTSRTTQIVIRIAIQDTNDNGPVFSESVYNITIGEMKELGSIIQTKIKAYDIDLTPQFHTVYYSVVEGEYSSYFVIVNPLIPSLTLLKKLDYETLKNFSITIMAKDSTSAGNVQFNSTCTLMVTVEDEDDQNPVFNRSMYTGIIVKADAVNSTIPITPPIYAYDPDLTLNAPIVYSFQGAAFVNKKGMIYQPETDVGPQFPSDVVGESSRVLAIDPITAVVTLINRPSADQMYLLVKATQADNPSRYGVALLAVTVQGTNVNAPVFSRESYQVVVTEVFPVGEAVTMVIASDADPGSVITYSLSDPSSSFTIDAISGDILLTKRLSYSAQSLHVLTVTASDGTLQSTCTVTIIVSQVNNKPPTIANSETSLNVTLERRKGAVVVDIDATDTDEGSVLSYRLLNHKDLFTINNEGVIKITAEPEALTSDTYFVTVVVSDGGNPSYEAAAVVRVNFQTIKPVASAQMAEKDTLLPIILGAIAGFFLLVAVILIVYICRRRQRDKEHLDRAQRQYPSQDPKALTFKKKQGTFGRQSKGVKIDFLDDPSDGETTVQVNPLNAANKGGYYNFGLVNCDTEPESFVNDIQVETAVVPFQQQHNDSNNNDNIYNNSQLSNDSDDFVDKNTLATFFRNGSLSTYRESSDSEISLNSPTESAGSKKGLMPGTLAKSHVPEESGGVWDRNGSAIPAIAKDMPPLDPDASVVPSSQKQELTVYF